MKKEACKMVVKLIHGSPVKKPCNKSIYKVAFLCDVLKSRFSPLVVVVVAVAVVVVAVAVVVVDGVVVSRR